MGKVGMAATIDRPLDKFIAGLLADRAAAPDREQYAYYWVDLGKGHEIAQYIGREWLPCGSDNGTPDQASFRVLGPISLPEWNV